MPRTIRLKFLSERITHPLGSKSNRGANNLAIDLVQGGLGRRLYSVCKSPWDMERCAVENRNRRGRALCFKSLRDIWTEGGSVVSHRPFCDTERIKILLSTGDSGTTKPGLNFGGKQGQRISKKERPNQTLYHTARISPCALGRVYSPPVSPLRMSLPLEI